MTDLQPGGALARRVLQRRCAFRGAFAHVHAVQQVRKHVGRDRVAQSAVHLVAGHAQPLCELRDLLRDQYVNPLIASVETLLRRPERGPPCCSTPSRSVSSVLSCMDATHVSERLLETASRFAQPRSALLRETRRRSVSCAVSCTTTRSSLQDLVFANVFLSDYKEDSPPL